MANSVKFLTRIKYRFDNLMSSGPIALIGVLGIISILIIILASIIIVSANLNQEGSEGSLTFFEAVWESLMRTLDAGTMGGDTGWGFRFVMLFVTLGGIFVVSTFIGILANGISNKLEELRKGHSFVLEKNHTLILGWSEKIFPVISELIIANENQKKSRIVILAPKDKVEMEDEIQQRIPDTKNTKIICRSGSPDDLYDLEIVNPNEARSIIILSPESKEPDIHVIKSILAVLNNPKRKADSYHIVAEINGHDNSNVAEMIGKDELVTVHSEDLIARVTAQTCRQSGLSIVYTELLDFDGAEIYFQDEPALTGKTFKDAIFSYEDSSIFGLRFKDGSVKINPPMNTVVESGDKIIAISEDDDTIIVSGKKSFSIDNSLINITGNITSKTEHTLIIGWNCRASRIITELDGYLSSGSTLTIFSDTVLSEINSDTLRASVNNISINIINGNTTDRKSIESINPKTFDHIIILCYTDRLTSQEADSRTLITLLHLRDIAEKENHNFSIVSEMLDIKNKELAEVTKADDFIISNKLISLLLTQLSENKELKKVFDDLFDAEGSEIYLKPVTNYIRHGVKVNFYTLMEAASIKNEIAIGYRQTKHAHDAEKSYGVVVNPRKSDMILFDEFDKIIVIAED